MNSIFHYAPKQRSANRTLVLRGLFSKKPIHSFCVYGFEVFNHTQSVAFTVSLVKVGKVFAGHGVALTAGLELVLGEFWATSFDVTVLCPWNASFAMGYFASFRGYPMRVS
jgi:uncharacterized membrane protein